MGVRLLLACVASVCDADTLRTFVNGVQIAATNGCAKGDGATYGIQIGQNGQAMDNLPADEWLVGAIDLVRMWSTARTPAQICAAAGLVNCGS